MKNIIKFLGVIALVAAIGFSMAGCINTRNPCANCRLETDSQGYQQGISVHCHRSGCIVPDHPMGTNTPDHTYICNC